MGYTRVATFGAQTGAASGTGIDSSTFNVTAGDLIIAAGRAATTNAFTIADDAGNTWTSIETVTTSDKLQAWYTIANANYSNNKVSIGFGTPCTFRAVVGSVYSGPHASPLDDHANRAYSSSTSTLETTANLGTTYADELVVGFAAPAALGETYTPSNLVDNNRRVEDYLALCDKIHTGTPAAN